MTTKATVATVLLAKETTKIRLSALFTTTLLEIMAYVLIYRRTVVPAEVGIQPVSAAATVHVVKDIPAVKHFVASGSAPSHKMNIRMPIIIIESILFNLLHHLCKILQQTFFRDGDY